MASHIAEYVLQHGASVIGCLGILIVHATLTKEDFRVFYEHFRQWCSKTSFRKQRDEQQLRYQKELLQARLQMLRVANQVLVQLAFLVGFVALWRFLKDQSFASICQVAGMMLAYGLHSCSQRLVKTDLQFRVFEVVVLSVHGLMTAGLVGESDIMTLFFAEKVLGAGLVFMSVTLFDLKMTLSTQICEAVLLMYKQFQLVGFEQVTLLMFTSSLTSHFVTAVLIVFTDRIIRSNIFAKMNSSDASSMMLGFRQVLRGVCDGDLLLDKSSCSIVDDASCLERLLKSKKLSKTNFLDLFLDSESRQRFLHFLSSDPEATPAMPRGLRLALQGADGLVSIDVFHTQVSNQGATGNDYCLLALKEDPEQSAPPDAPETTPPTTSVKSEAIPSRCSSTVSEVVEAYDELVEIALLVSNENAMFDIKEAHLAFRRQSSEPAIESGMPTLRRFIRPSDWDRMEKMFDIVTNLPPSDVQQRCTFRHPMLFRLPGESRSYLRSRQTSVYLAGQVVPDHPAHFWMNFSSFDASQIRRPREPELQGIYEES